MSALPTSSRRLQIGITLLGTSLFALLALPVVVSPGATAKTPGKTYCYNRICHRVLTLAQTRRAVGKRKSLIASYYSHCKVDRFNPCGLTSSGAKFRPSHADNAASPIYPNGTKLLVWNPANKRAAVIRIDNAGPYWRNRTLDLSRAAAQKLGFRHRGVARLVVQVLSAPSRREATYRRHRTYAPVKGYLGRFASIASASQVTSSRAIKPATSIVQTTSKAKRKTETKTVNIANVVLPVKNVYLAERRIWLARMVETGSVSVGLSIRPKVRLPLRSVRKPTVARSKSIRSKRRKVAALAIQSSRKFKRKSKARQPQASRKKSASISTTQKKRLIRKVRKNNKPVTPIKKKTVKAPSTVAKALPKLTGKPNTSPAAKPAAKQAVRPVRAKMVWRRNILGISKAGT